MTRLIVLLSLAACRSPLATPLVTVGPDAPHSGDDLVAEVSGADEYALVWLRDGTVVEGLTDGVVPASMTRRGESWRAQAVVSAGRRSVTGEASVTIRNAPPEVDLTLAPAEPQAGDALVVAAIAWDADDDPLTVVRTWTRNGEVVAIEGDTVPADTTRRGEVWAVEVVANDGFERGPVARAEVTVVNAAPEVTSAALSPSEPRTTDTLTVSYGAWDADGDAVSTEVHWTVNGAVVDGVSGRSLVSSHFVKGDRVAAVLTPTDGTSSGAPVEVATTIANSAPSAPGVTIDPVEPLVGEALHCVVTAQPTDADGDPVRGWAAAWSVDGVAYSGGVTTTISGDTVAAGVTQGDERWACSLRAYDGEDWGAFEYAARTVAWDGFVASQPIAGRTVTCASVTNDESWTQCNGLRVDGKAFPNGLTCGLGWSSSASPWTDHASFCATVTGSTQFMADYTCGTVQERVTWVGGAWGTRDDNGYTDSLRCRW